MSAPGNRNKYIFRAVALALTMILALAAYNREYLFHTHLYEASDPGAFSLSVIRAGHFRELYGAYSRWGFHHPGPSVFYYYAALTGVFYNALHAVPTPYNAQVLGTIILMISFLCAGLGMMARWTQSRFFLPFAVLLAALHLTAVDLRLTVTSTWPPFMLPLVIFCLLVATASVAAGQGEDLPLVVIAGSVAIHSHVAQPLFVLPMFLLAYSGLALSCFRSARRVSPPASMRFVPWKVFPRAHVVAGVLAGIFLLPLVLDLFKGSQSNLALILAHMRSQSGGPRHPYLDTIYYFLHFAVYRTRGNPPWVPLGAANPQVIGHFMATHLKMMLLWTGALLSPLLAVAVRHRRNAASLLAREAVPVEATEEARGARGRFLLALASVLAVSLLLTSYWAHIQDGELFYYNAWFNYGILLALATLGAIALSDLLESLSLGSAWREPATWMFSVFCLAASALVCVHYADRARCSDYSEPMFTNQANTVMAALREEPNAPRTKLLLFPEHDAWGAATGVAVLLKHLGYQPLVKHEWHIMFGDDLALESGLDVALPALREPFEIWRLLPVSKHPELIQKSPLIDGYGLEVGGGKVNPASGTTISLVGAAPNIDTYALYGWSPPGGPDSPFVWSVGKSALLYLHVEPVAATEAVEMVLDCFPVTVPGKGENQRLGVRWNGTDLGTIKVTAAGAVRVLIPAALWNATPHALLRMEFPDAVSPKELRLSDDPRQLAFGTKSIMFHAVPAATPAPAH